MSRTTTLALAVFLAALIGVAVSVFLVRGGDQTGQPGTVRTTGRALIGGPFALTDHTGQPRTEKDLLGKYALISFGYSHCPDVCPTTLQTMSEALEALGPLAERIRPVFVTVDPERDTVARLKTYHDAFDKRFMMLTGSVTAIAKAAKAYKVGYNKMKPNADGSYLVNHSALIYLMGPKGDYITHYPYKIDPKKLAEALRKRLAQ